ncbi:Ig-like domain-containing protein [Pantoea sp. S18]|uniref:Ig-like domain-containing protein n=1 Tax=Pantoea sp. S18 TaxID=3019892 RepID=UPI002B21A067|nr:Ig-like domain-containing protein [Pantoea sp. S18]MEA5104084.1 Ig-like domain-containing protein [Pantoea sp. S18]
MNILDYTGTTYIERATSLPTIPGDSGEKGKTGIVALVSVGGKFFELPVDPVTGKFTWVATEAMPDGDYSVSIAIKDRAGNVGQPTLRTLRIDTTPPEAPLLINLYDDQGAEQRSFDPGSTTDDKRPTLTGVAQKGTTVYLLNDKNEKIGSAVADKDTGVWKMEPMQDLEDGTNALRLVAEEKFADVTRAGTPSAPFTIVIGEDASVLPPNTITIKEAIDDVGTYMGKLSSGALTDDTTPTLRGDVSAGNTVTVYYRLAGSSTWTGSATATVNGTEWSWTPGSALAYGEYEFQASIGGFSSSLFTLDIATAADIASKTRIEMVKDDFGAWQGELSSGAITDDATPTFSGRGEANGKVVLRFAQVGQLANTVVVDVDSSGKWTWTPASGLPAGNWSFEVQPQGHASWSNTFSLSITGSDGFNPVITDGYDDMGTPKALANGDTTDDTTPTLNGQAEANSIVYLRATNGTNSTVYSVTADTAGNWTWTPSANLLLGDWAFQVKKNSSSSWGDSFNLTILQSDNEGDVDFEHFEDGLRYNTSIWLNNDITKNVGFSIFNAPGALKPFVEMVSTAQLGESSLGEWAVKLTTGEAFVFGSADYSSFEKPFVSAIDSFSLQIYNPSLTETKSLSSWLAVGKDITKKRYFNLTLKPGLNTFTEEDIPASALTKGSTFSYFYIENSGINEILVDNFHWGIKNVNVQLFNELEDNGIIYFDSAEEFGQTSIIGNEDKTDTLEFTGKDQLLNLTALNSKVDSIEIFDITGTGDNTLKLDFNTLLQHGEKDLFIEDGKTQLLVKGNEGDVVQLKDILPEGSDISEWQHQDGTVTVAGVEYDVYSHGDDAELLVQQGVKTELV